MGPGTREARSRTDAHDRALRSKVRAHSADCGLESAKIPSHNNGLVGHSLGMVSPTALNANTIEMNRGFRAEPDAGKNLEVAMAAVVFRDLQTAGLIPSEAKLASVPPTNPSGAAGDTYESRLVALIRDEDGNGRLDLDLSQLKSAGILSSDATEVELIAKLSSAPRPALSDDFLEKQDSASKLWGSAAGVRRGQEVQRLSRQLVLTSPTDRAVEDFVQSGAARAATPAGAQKVSEEALLRAEVFTRRGDQRHAQDLLARTGEKLLGAGRNDEARPLFQALQAPPYADAPINLVEAQRQDELRRVDGYDPAKNVIPISAGGNETTLKEADFKSTYGELATRRLAQADLSERMSQTLGRPVDPHRFDDARDYFAVWSQGRPTAEVAAEYERYLKANFVHSGDGVTWDPSMPIDQRSDRVDALIAPQPVDASGRKIVDCEAYQAATAHIFAGIVDAEGAPRFEVLQAGKVAHVTAGVFEKAGGGGFIVSNDVVSAVSPKVKGEEQRNLALAENLAGDRYEVIGIGPRASDATVIEGRQLLLGRHVWVGDHFEGTVDAALRAEHANSLSPSLSYFLKVHFEGAP